MQDLVSYPIPGRSVIVQLELSAANILRKQAAAAEDVYGILTGSVREGEPRWITIRAAKPLPGGQPLTMTPGTVGFYWVETDEHLSSSRLDVLQETGLRPPIAFALSKQADGQVRANVYIRDADSEFPEHADYRFVLHAENVVVPWTAPAAALVARAHPVKEVSSVGVPSRRRWLQEAAIVSLLICGLGLFYSQMDNTSRGGIANSMQPSVVSDFADRTRETRVAEPPAATRKPDSAVEQGVARAARPGVMHQPLQPTVLSSTPPAKPSAVKLFSGDALPTAPRQKARDGVAPEFVPAKVIRWVNPATPAAAAALLSVEAQVDVTVKIDAAGHIADARVSAVRGAAAGLVTAEALNAVRLFRFQPARQGKHAVPSSMVLTFRFRPPQ